MTAGPAPTVAADAPGRPRRPTPPPATPARRAATRILGLGLALNSLAIALQAGLLPKLGRSVAGWMAPAWPLLAAPSGDTASPLEDALLGLYRRLSLGQPLLPWLLWLACAGGLLLLAPRAPRRRRAPRRPRPAGRAVAARVAVALALAVIVAGGLAARAANLIPDAAGIWPASDFDEQVYYTSARLLAQGELPYRDFFLAHPPGVAYTLAPGLAGQPLWGGPGAFGAARQWVLVFSLLGVPLIFLIGRRLGGAGCGLLAATVLALDGRAAGVAVLETLVNFWSLAALLLYLYIPRSLPRGQRALWIALCGLCCAAALLTKIPGAAIAAVLPLHALLARRPAVASGIVAATAGGVLVALAPFLLLAPESLVRETFFFQLLRPQEVKLGLDHALRIAAYPETALTVALGTLGLLLLGGAILRAAGTAQPGLRRWLVVPLWAVPVLAVFIFGRSYHAPYYVQWAPPLALLAGALVARPVWRALLPGRPATRRLLAWAGPPLAAALLLPLAGSAWQATFAVARDTVYRPAGATVRDLSAAKSPVLAFDPGYAFVAGRPPAPVPGGGRLVDSAGFMTYSGLGLDQRAWGDLIATALQFDKERNASAIFQSTAAQAAILGGFWQAPIVVVDGKIGLPQLRPQTLGLLGALAVSRQEVEHVSIYHLDPTRAAGQDFGALALRALTFEPLAADGSGSGVTLLRADTPVTTVTLPAGRVLQIGCYWQPAAGAPDARIRLTLVTPTGDPIVDLAQAPDEDRAATHLWNPALTYPDLHNLQIPPALPPGTYRLLLGVSAANQPATRALVPAEIVVTSRP